MASDKSLPIPHALCLDRPKNNRNLGKSWEPLKPYRNVFDNFRYNAFRAVQYTYYLSPQSLWPAINRCPYALCLDRPKNNGNPRKSSEPLKPYRNCTTELGLSRVRNPTTAEIMKTGRSRLSDSEYVLLRLKFSTDFDSKKLNGKLRGERQYI